MHLRLTELTADPAAAAKAEMPSLAALGRLDALPGAQSCTAVMLMCRLEH